MEMSNPMNPNTVVQEEDDTKPLITELVGQVCYKDVQSSLHNFTSLSWAKVK